ncbi:MAG: type II toxin-antitoxin system Phd/YefM family antitoxin [Rhizobiaceae bacterium]|nr:type II toxin-antitoxin system prevent-host-death family antitoxin [Hyphomicrobiales bacterium]
MSLSIYSQDKRQELAMQVNILEAKNRLSQLIRSVQAGEQVIIANRGEPVARLVSAKAPEAAGQDVGSGHAILDWIERHRLPAYARRSVEEIDAAIAEERASWD